MKTITGKWQDGAGQNVSFGILSLKLNQDAVVLATSQIAPRNIAFTLDTTGSIPAATQIWANDELNPAGTFYSLTVMDSGGGVVYGPENFTISGGSPINLNNIIPSGSGGGGGGGGGGGSVNVQDSVQFISTTQAVGFLAATNTLIELTGGGAGITITLPSAVGVSGQTMRLVRIDAAAGAVTVNTTGGQTISGRANWSLTNQWQYAQLESDNANWIVTAFN
jgi:hypothetical protein